MTDCGIRIADCGLKTRFSRNPQSEIRNPQSIGEIMERIEASGLDLKDQVISINRVTKVVKGGKNLSFAALVVVGNENGIKRVVFDRGGCIYHGRVKTLLKPHAKRVWSSRF